MLTLHALQAVSAGEHSGPRDFRIVEGLRIEGLGLSGELRSDLEAGGGLTLGDVCLGL